MYCLLRDTGGVCLLSVRCLHVRLLTFAFAESYISAQVGHAQHLRPNKIRLIQELHGKVPVTIQWAPTTAAARLCDMVDLAKRQPNKITSISEVMFAEDL
jgi:hypothetical protein